MEEKKEIKCDSCESMKSCQHCMHTMHGCCGNWKGRKCHIVRIIIMIIVLSIVFCAGASFGEHENGFRGRGNNQRYMMGNGYGFNGNFENGKAATGSATVQVAPNVNTLAPVPAAQ